MMIIYMLFYDLLSGSYLSGKTSKTQEMFYVVKGPSECSEVREGEKSELSELLTALFCGQINNAGTNKGFRPLLQFSDEDIKQVCLIK